MALNPQTGFDGPIEHLIGRQFRSRREPKIVGILEGVGCGYFLCFYSPGVRSSMEVTAARLERSWELLTE